MSGTGRASSPRQKGRRRFLVWNLLAALAALVGRFGGNPPRRPRGDRGEREAMYYTTREER